MAALTLPSDTGEFHVYDGLGNRIMDTRGGTVYVWGSIEILENVHVGGNVDIDGTVHISGDPSLLIDGTVQISGNVEIDADLNVTGVTNLGGTLTLAADLDAAGFTIEGARLTTGTGNVVIEDDTISVGSNVIGFSGSLVTFSDGVAIADSLQVSGTSTFTGTATFNGALDHNGPSFGVLGATPSGAWLIPAAATDLTSVITLANSLRSEGINRGNLNP